MNKLAVIGAGQIGTRHLQALALTGRPVQIQVVDPSRESLAKARQHFNGIRGKGLVRKVEYGTDLSFLDAELDVVIIATLSDVRKTVIESLVREKRVRYMILEKVVFQNSQHFSAVHRLFEQHGIRAWVNCPSRMNDFYRKLKSRLAQAEKTEYGAGASHLGLGCNAIHHLDLVSYLTGQYDWRLDGSGLDPSVISSKRAGFYEFTGTITGTSPGGNTFHLTSYSRGSAPLAAWIQSDVIRCFIRPPEQKAWMAEAPGWNWREVPFVKPYQSQLTHRVVEQLLDTGNCELPTYRESWKLHVPLLHCFISHLRKAGIKEGNRCRIT